MKERIFAAAFVVLVSTAIIGFSAGSTGASFVGSTTNPNQSWNTQNVTPPASFTSATSKPAGQIDLVWTATASPAGSHTLTYLVLRGPVGGVNVGHRVFAHQGLVKRLQRKLARARTLRFRPGLARTGVGQTGAGLARRALAGSFGVQLTH